MTFCGARVLVVEDEAIIALDLAMAVEEAQGIVVGPAATVFEALELVDNETIAVAILDCCLLDGEVTPVACRLVARGVPLLIHSATGLPDELREQHPHLPVVFKPVPVAQLVLRLLDVMNGNDQRLRQHGWAYLR